MVLRSEGVCDLSRSKPSEGSGATTGASAGQVALLEEFSHARVPHDGSGDPIESSCCGRTCSASSAPCSIIPYASRTGTRRNLAALRAAGWRLMISATGSHRHEGFPYAIDNGAFTAWQQQTAWDEASFLRLVESHGAGADFIVVPDIVGAGLESLRFSMTWIERLRGVGRRRLLAVQDGMAPWDIEALIGPELGIFVGGSTDRDRGETTWGGGWKWRSLRHWAHLARSRRAYLHVARVNSTQRIRECILAGADSCDGTNATIYSVNTHQLDQARRQIALLGDNHADDDLP